MEKTIITYSISIAILLILYLGLWENLEWAQNLLIFCIWLNFAINVFVYVAITVSGKCKDSIKGKNYRSINFIHSVIFDIIIIVCLVAFGWFWTASSIFISATLKNIIFEDKK